MKKHLVMKALRENYRFDGRKRDEYRKIVIETGISNTAEGSARVKIGDTEVLAGVKLSIGTPYPDAPDEGTLMVGAELMPIANPKYELGPPDVSSVELARIVDRGIRESKAIDVKKLCIIKGEKIWIVSVDICTLNTAGNLFDAAALAALAALKDTKFPKYENGEIDYKTKTTKGLPITLLPIGVTVVRVGDQLVMDPLPEEEDASDVRLTVTTTEEGKICALQKGGSSSLTIEDVDKMIELALHKSKELRKLL